MTSPRFASAVSTRADTKQAEKAAVDDLLEGLGDARPDLVLCFATRHHAGAFDRLARDLAAATDCPAVAGCTAETVIGGGRELEKEPALCLWAGHLPDTRVTTFTCKASPKDGGGAEFGDLPSIEDPARAGLLLFADPFTFPADLFLRHLDEVLPGVPVAGGLASSGSAPGQNRLMTGAGHVNQGCVGVVVEGATEVLTVVSQGCRPVGHPWVVTDCHQNLVRKLGGRAATEALMETFHELGEDDQELFQRSPFLGLAVDPTKSEFDRGDFVARGLLGMNPKDKTVAVADLVRRGQTVQFLVRDADSAGEDLRSLLRSGGADAGGPAGALLFSCNGRGTRLFPVPDHDVTTLQGGLAPDVPVAGFFAAGEIGPVGGRNLLHGFTASVAILRARR